ncbi:MAG: hypothetical protein RR101_14760 [Burkholderiaceae bacterium]
MSKTALLSALLITAVALAACGKKEAPPPPPAPVAAAPAPVPALAPVGVVVGDILLGKAIGPDKHVVEVFETFAPRDTIHAAVNSMGIGNATLKAKWTYTKDGKTVPIKNDAMTIVSTGPATNEFHISKPDGWPTGDYMVEIFIDDKPAGTRHFTVK